MLTIGNLVSFFSRKSNVSMAHLILVIPLLVLLAGCTGEGGGGPMVSSLSTPTDSTAGLDSDQGSDSKAADSDGEEDPKITMTSTSTGVTARVAWDRPSDFNVAGYTIYYGKRSSKEPSSEESNSEESGSEESDPSVCSYGESQDVNAPPATITGLEPNTQYFFAIRAHNEKESLCSNQIMALTPPVES